jgi:hypothetical protein
MDESDMDVFSEFLHGSDEDDYEDATIYVLKFRLVMAHPLKELGRDGRLLPNQIIFT